MLLSVRRALVVQLVILAVMLAAGAYLGGVAMALALGYGGAIAMVNAGLLWWRWRQGAQRYHCDGGRHMKSFYRSMLERFFVVGILLAVGFGLLKLQPLALLVGFVVGQLAWVTSGAALRERT